MTPPGTQVRANWEKAFDVRKITAGEWKTHRPIFTKLYLQENLKLLQIREIMALKHGFYGNKRQFDRKIREWGLNKNLKKKDAIAMLRIQEKRKKEQGKSTNFKFNKQPVSQEKIMRHVGDMKVSASESTHSLVATPEHVEYCTPPPSPQAGNDNIMQDSPGTSTYSTDTLIEDVQMEDLESVQPNLVTSIRLVDHSHQQIYSVPGSLSLQGPSTYPSNVTFVGPPLSTQNYSSHLHSTPHAQKKLPTERSHLGGLIKQTFVGTIWERKEKALRLAALNGNVLDVSLLVNEGTDISGTCENGRTPLFEAASGGHEDVIKLLLERGANISTAAKNGDTPLHRAALKGHRTVVHLLLERGADISAANNNGYTPLHDAASQGHEAVVRLLLDKGAKVSTATKAGDTPLHWAASKGPKSMVHLLLDRGADISALNNNGNTPLHDAASNGPEAVVKLLLDRGMDILAVNKLGYTPLHNAVFEGHVGVVRLLLEDGGDRYLSTTYSGKPLPLTASDRHEEIDRLLLDSCVDNFAEDLYTPLNRVVSEGYEAVFGLPIGKGAKASTVINGGQYTALHGAAFIGDVAMVQLLLKKGVNFLSGCLDTPLHLAALKGHEEVVYILLEGGAEVSAANKDLYTPLHLAVLNEHEAVVQLLLKKGADPNGYMYPDTPLHLAADTGHESIVQLLLKKGADTSATSTRGDTPLHKAVASNRHNEEVIWLLIREGADVSAMNANGNTSLHMAVSSHQHSKAVVELLLENGADVSAKNEKGNTPLHIAVALYLHHEAVIQRLPGGGADTSVKSNDDTPTGDEATFLHWYNEVVIYLLLGNGADPLLQNKEGRSVIKMAEKSTMYSLLIEAAKYPKEQRQKFIRELYIPSYPTNGPFIHSVEK